MDLDRAPIGSLSVDRSNRRGTACMNFFRQVSILGKGGGQKLLPVRRAAGVVEPQFSANIFKAIECDYNVLENLNSQISVQRQKSLRKSFLGV